MKLEVGKYYKTRNGQKVGPIGIDGNGSYRFKAYFNGWFLAWDSYGTFDNNCPNHPRDLIAEWADDQEGDAK